MLPQSMLRNPTTYAHTTIYSTNTINVLQKNTVVTDQTKLDIFITDSVVYIIRLGNISS